MQTSIEKVERSSGGYGVLLNPGKCELLCAKGSPPPTVPLRIADSEVKVVNTFRYLGSLLQDDGLSSSDVDARISKAKSAFWRLRRLWQSAVSGKVKFNVYNSCVRSVLLYGSEAWVLPEPLATKLQVFERECWRFLLKVRMTDRVSNDDLLARARIASGTPDYRRPMPRRQDESGATSDECCCDPRTTSLGRPCSQRLTLRGSPFAAVPRCCGKHRRTSSS